MITLHADPGAASGGNGTTNALSGANCAYQGIGPAIVALEASGPSARGDAVTLKLWNQTGIADTDPSGTMVQYDVSTTAANYLQIEGAYPLTGVFDESLWYLEVTNRFGLYNNVTNYLRLKNLQVRIISNDGGGHVAFKTLNANMGANPECIAENIILSCVGTNKAGSIGVNNKNRTLGTGYSRNLNILAYGFANGFAPEDVVGELFENCAAYDNDFGWVGGGTNGIVINCAAHGNGTNWVTAFEAASSNNSGDTGDDPPGSGDSTGTPTLVKRSFANYIQTSGDTVLKNKGTTGTYATTDLRGFTRSTWDIGPFESVTGSAAVTGTATASINETDVRSGGKTIVVTLSNDTFIPANSTQDITVVGTPQSGTGNNVAVTLTFNVPPVEDDVVIAWGGHDSNGGSSVTPTTGGYTQVINDTASQPYFGVWYKRMGSSPDTTVAFPASGAANDGAAWGAIVLRGVHTDIQGATATTAGPTAGTNPNAASITVGTAYSMVLAIAVSTSSDAAPGTVASYTVGGSAGINVSGVDASTSSARRIKSTTGAEDPAAWSAWTTGTWKTATLEIKRRIATPFADIRATIRTNIDSGQSEGTGWDARIGTILPLTNIVRTAPNIVTATLAADGTYDITGQETITVTVPAAAVNNGVVITGSPTFTIAVDGAVAARFNYGLLLGVN